VGAYSPGSDPRVDEAVRLAPSFDALLRQRTDEKTAVADTVAVLTKLVSGKGR
jgi:flagellum-specific ATP synthase